MKKLNKLSSREKDEAIIRIKELISSTSVPDAYKKELEESINNFEERREYYHDLFSKDVAASRSSMGISPLQRLQKEYDAMITARELMEVSTNRIRKMIAKQMPYLTPEQVEIALRDRVFFTTMMKGEKLGEKYNI